MASKKRTYNQYCALARSLDVLGERWTLLVVRELLSGPKRFRDLLEYLPGIGTNLLAARLKELEAAGVLQKVLLPPPASSMVYELTPRGQALKGVVGKLQQWGLGILGQPKKGEVFIARWAMQGLLAVFDAKAAGSFSGAFQFQVEKELFHIVVNHGVAEARQGSAAEPLLTIKANNQGFMAMAAGHGELTAAEKKKQIAFEGAPAVREKFFAFFRRPIEIRA